MSSELRDRVVDDDDYFGLLDIFVVIAEWWIVMLASAAIAAAAAYFFVSERPSSYEAVALAALRPLDVALVNTPTVIAPVSAKIGLSDPSELTGRLSVAQETSGFWRVAVTADSAEEATRTLTEILAQLNVASRPQGEQKKLVEAKFARLERSIADLELARQAIVDAPGTPSLSTADRDGATLLNLTRDLDARSDELAVTRQELEGFGASQVIQPPVATERPASARRTRLMVLAAGGVSFVVLAIAILRELWLRAAADPVNAQKTTRIKRAFGLGRTSA